ncbi:MAG: N-6 DNA methylase [Chloroflexi bacterium]|nr:N-6 DNA methylase [Chloroflexota bacterium]
MPLSSRAQFEQQLAELVTKFEQGRAEYTQPGYPEAEVRSHFIDPFFEALGWDMRDARALGRDREVTREVSEKSGRPDYAFRLNNQKLFYVEAKAPHVPLERTDVILQLKRYAWSASVDLGLISDFEELRIYDTRAKPNRKNPDAGLIRALHYSDFRAPATLDLLWLLSRDQVAQGSLAELLKLSSVPQRQRKPVDLAFLDDLARWRAELAQFVFKIQSAESTDLNGIVQVFLDRLIFIRVAEDRAILADDLAPLQSIARHWNDHQAHASLARELGELFAQINLRFDGDIFRPHACESIAWDLDAEMIIEIINGLYEAYRFDVIPVELLGSIYERYLGKTIRVTATRAVVEDKPEVRKAGGVYYTPQYVVDYIVAQTVGKLIEGKTPAQIAQLKILDPACGSGSFLIGAYQKLLDYHAAYYAHRAHERGGAMPGQARLMREPRAAYGEFKLSLAQKAEILRNNLFGVDIDAQAVEITMLSLYIKLLEGERGAIMGQAVLPRLYENIRCGNSLISHDIGELSDEDSARINPFTMESKREGFDAIMETGGFDAVIGNPPYGALLKQVDKAYLNSHYTFQSYQLDSYQLFLERALRDLVKRDGFFGMIIPNPWLTNLLQTHIRKFVVENSRIVEIVHFQFPVFPKVTVDTEIVILQKSDPQGWQATATIVESRDALADKTGAGIRRISHPQDKWRVSAGAVINIFLDAPAHALARKCLDAGAPLESFCAINVGIKPYQVGKGKPPQTRKIVENRVYDSHRQVSKLYRAYLRGSDIGRYKIAPLEPRYLKFGAWLAEPRPAANFDAPEKIVMRQTGDSIVATLDTQQYLCLNNMHVLVPTQRDLNLRYILGVLNSRLLNWYYHTLNPEVGEALAEVKKTNVARLPIRAINFADPADRARHEQMIARVARITQLHQQLPAAPSDAARTRIEREINVSDEQIDALVYELYGLTPEEIRIVENG